MTHEFSADGMALIDAARVGDVAALKITTTSKEEQLTALHVSVINNCMECVAYFIQHLPPLGANPRFQQLVVRILNDAVHINLDMYAAISQWRQTSRGSPGGYQMCHHFLAAAENGRCDFLQRFFLQVDPHHHNEALLCATQFNHADCVAFLLDTVSPEAVDRALRISVEKNSYASFELLLGATQNVEAVVYTAISLQRTEMMRDLMARISPEALLNFVEYAVGKNATEIACMLLDVCPPQIHCMALVHAYKQQNDVLIDLLYPISDARTALQIMKKSIDPEVWGDLERRIERDSLLEHVSGLGNEGLVRKM